MSFWRRTFNGWLDYGGFFLICSFIDYLFTGGTTVWTNFDIFRNGMIMIIFGLIGHILSIIFRKKTNDATN